MSKFKLPENWAVETTKENNKTLFKWAEFTWLWNESNKYITSNKTHTRSLEDTAYTEITFDQFEEYVLGIKKKKIIIKENYSYLIKLLKKLKIK